MTKRRTKQIWKIIFNVVTLVALGVFIYAIRDQIIGTIDNLSNVNAWALVLMVPAQMINYFANTRTFQHLFRLIGEKIKFWFMTRVNIELTFVNTIFPSGGVSGFSYFGLRLRSKGISPGKSTLVYMMKFIVLFISFQVLLFTGLVILAIGGNASNLVILIAGSLATFLLVGTLLLGYIIGSNNRINSFTAFITRGINRIIHMIRPKNPETISLTKVKEIFSELHDNYKLLKKDFSQLRQPLLYGLLANFAEILTIYVVYIAFGNWVNPGAVIIAYAVANFAGLISVFPGGVGIYEALMTGVLATAGIPPAVSIPVTVMYRILNMLIQLPPGYILYQQYLHREERVSDGS